MAMTNSERISKAMDLLQQGLTPFVVRELESSLGSNWGSLATAEWKHELKLSDNEDGPYLDVGAVLRLMWEQWNSVFSKTLGHAERSLVSELRTFRNKWAHQEPFSGDDTYRVLDSSTRLLTAVSAPQSDEIQKMKLELMRVRFEEQARSERHKNAGTAIESQVSGVLPPWRTVVTPHRDVASGRYQQAEFAADLWQVSMGEGSDEYRDPKEFFRRTYLTEGLRILLIGAVNRLAGNGGDPVVQLQTNFGGGKTHSMLALYHLFSGANLAELSGVDGLMKEADVTQLPSVKRVVVVGNKISPGNPVVKADGTVIHTLWGEIAYQLGGKAAYERVRADDERATSPGDVLRELMNEYGPCLILIDEWVAYARQLHEKPDLPAGTFETQFTFAQTLTESAKLAKNCLVVISLPASDMTQSPHTIGDDTEVGGQRGRAALDRLRNAIGRVEASWRPASAEEGFEIVRRRLFEPLLENSQYTARDAVARAFYELYRSQGQEFPPETRESAYEKRIQAAYPIHPEIFDRLYSDWSTLIKFQRTRGVLRLMAAVIHSLWEKDDRNPLILPANIPIDDPRVQAELTRYLSDNWVPVIAKDVDGPNALPLQLDGEVPNLGKHHAARRVARTIYLGSAPTATAANRGIEDRRIKLGCVMPGESPAVFGDALRRLSSAATYLYQDSTRYWYSTQPTVTKLAEDRAEQLRRDPDGVATEVDRRLRFDLRQTGDFHRLHALPQTSADVPDDGDARLVVLGIDYPHSKESESKAIKKARDIWENRGNTPRLHRNSLVFLAVDSNRLQDLDEAIRRYLAWDSVLTERDTLDLSAHQTKQAEAQRASADSTIVARLPEAYQWLLVPTQHSPKDAVAWGSYRLTGPDALAVRASKKLRSEELLVTTLAGTRLRMELDRIPLWRGNHVGVRQLINDFSQYVYLPRLKDSLVLLEAIQDGLKLMSWPTESFGYADRWDELSGRYVGLRAGQLVSVAADSASALIVKPEAALKQMKEDQADKPTPAQSSAGGQFSSVTGGVQPEVEGKVDQTPEPTVLRRFHGSVLLDPVRTGADAGRVAEEVISHLVGLTGARVKVTLEIEAEVSDGVPDRVVRTVTENSRSLKFTTQAFERD